MAVDIWPISMMTVPVDIQLSVDAVVNPFGGRQVQRIVTDLPHTGSDGEGGQTKHVGTWHFKVAVSRLHFFTQPVTGNANLDNSIRELWKFYKDKFYNISTGRIQYLSFYWYNTIENDDISTWFGDTAKSGTNCRGEAVTEATGRYLVIFDEPNLSVTQFTKQICQFGVSISEVES